MISAPAARPAAALHPGMPVTDAEEREPHPFLPCDCTAGMLAAGAAAVQRAACAASSDVSEVPGA